MERRFFLKASGIFTAGFYVSRYKAIAGPFAPGELGYQIPFDKKLDPKWVKSLYERGNITRYLKSKNELNFIGMPVGGIFTGTLYVGGDGRLWLWDIFNSNQEGIEPKTVNWGTELHVGKKVRSRDGSAYVAPAKQNDLRLVEQGFAFRFKTKGETIVKKMEAFDWDEIVFEAGYPLAKIHYIDKSLQVSVTAEVYSPFIPLDENDSGLPATVYQFQFINNTKSDISVSVIGWLENKVCLRKGAATDYRMNRTIYKPTQHIVECSMKTPVDEKLQTAADFGTMAITLLNETKAANIQTDFSLPLTHDTFEKGANGGTEKPIGQTLIGAIAHTINLAPGKTGNFDFAIAWYFPNLRLHKNIQDSGRFYTTRFSSASDVLSYLNKNFDKLSTLTKRWHETWFDSTLPSWFLERTFQNISTLATTTAHRFTSGRFYAWEGVGCCEGTCTHVWQYAQAMGRIFPAVEKDTRSRVDLGLSLQENGMIWYRGEVVKTPAIDGQAGTILRIYREHQMSKDKSFLQNNWEKIKRAIQFVIKQDKNKDGMEDTPMENTLDAVWDGEIAWLVGLCIAAVKAGELMAKEMNDTAFAQACADYVEKGKMNMEEKLFNGEYFIHKPDEQKGRSKLGSYNTCHIDQVYGQSWAWQVGLGRILDREKTLSALRALWKYNFTPDVGPYIKEHTGGRPYALEGDGGMIMNTNPKNESKPYGDNVTWQLGYFHECMSGFEHQVAAHMMAEGMIDEALVLTRMIHDRYHAVKRNPFNEIECSDHYARAMASYGTFISACGFESNGPSGYIRFAPKIGADNFKAPFTAAGCWGSYSQKRTTTSLNAIIKVKYGVCRIRTFGLMPMHKIRKVTVIADGKKINAEFKQEENNCTVTLQNEITIIANKEMQIYVE